MEWLAASLVFITINSGLTFLTYRLVSPTRPRTRPKIQMLAGSGNNIFTYTERKCCN